MGHAVGRTARPFGGGQAIEIDRNREILKAGSDPRKDGVALAI
jgi:gamma-glutamyltranspeptidase / glutathione hydrolase